MIFQYMGEHLNLICRHASDKHKTKSNSRQLGKFLYVPYTTASVLHLLLLLLLIIQKTTQLLQLSPSYLFLDVEQLFS